MAARQGFNTMDPARHREICSKGGKACHAKGTGHQWTAEEARIAGAKGGKKTGGRNRKQPKLPLTPATEAAERPQGDARHEG